MAKNRVEAFSDGVLAIIITIMVLELKRPSAPTFAALRPLIPVLLSYLLSFIYIGIYWNNHHHLFHACQRVNGGILWANLHLLFWLSLFPFATGWIGEVRIAPEPVALYGGLLLLSGAAFTLLQFTIIREQGKNSLLKSALGKDWKGKVSLLIYASGIPLAYVSASAAMMLYAVVALIWLIPDRRIERALHSGHAETTAAGK